MKPGALTFLRVDYGALVEAGYRLLTSIHVKRLEAQATGTVGDQLDPESPREDPMLVLLESRRVVPADDLRAVHRDERDVQRLSDRRPDLHAAAQEVEEQVALGSVEDAAELERTGRGSGRSCTARGLPGRVFPS